MGTKLPSITLFGNHRSPGSVLHSDGLTKERQINRAVLIDVAPDREELLSSGAIEEIRERLKIRVRDPDSHWLYRIRQCRNVHPTRGDATVHYSLFNDTATRRRGLSVSSTSSGTSEVTRGLRQIDDAHIDIWSSQSLSTEDKLISPRPLGPTHILVVSAKERGAHFSDSDSDSSDNGTDVLELPINDLLFLLNAPNVRNRGRNGSTIPVLPRRLHKELPRVALRVPALRTFPELVVYLHTKDRDALFKALIPDWIAEIIHSSMSMPIEPRSAPESLEEARDIDDADMETLSKCQCISSLGLARNMASLARGCLKCLLKPISPIISLVHTSSGSTGGTERNLRQTADNEIALRDLKRRQQEEEVAARAILCAYLNLETQRRVKDSDGTEGMSYTPFDETQSVASGHGEWEKNVLKDTINKLDDLSANIYALGHFELSLLEQINMYRHAVGRAFVLLSA